MRNTVTVGTRLTRAQNTSLEYLATVRNTSKASLIAEALEAQFGLTDIEQDALSFFDKHAHFIAQHTQQVEAGTAQ